MKNRIIMRRRLNCNNSGSTMVEILVAFMVVLLLIVLFTKVITVSGSILMKSRGKIEETQTFNENYYKVSSQNARDKDRYQSLEFNLEIDTEKTDDKNKADMVSLPLEFALLQVYEDTETGLKMYSFTTEEESSVGE